jgi:hypothetical protein
MTARNRRREMADLLLIAWGHGHDAVTLSSWALFVKQLRCAPAMSRLSAPGLAGSDPVVMSNTIEIRGAVRIRFDD